MNRLPTGNELFLDHVGYFLADLEGAAARFGRLGFTVSPVNIHYNDADGELVRSGTANRLIVFEAGYIEALGQVADTPLGAELAAGVARYEGLHLLALAHGRVEEHDAGGTDMRPTVFLRRPLEDGRIVRATVRRATAAAMPEGRVQLLTHETPELIWLPGMDRHANAARALTGYLQIVADPEEAAERYARFANRPARRSGPVFEIALDRGRFALAGPDALGALLPDATRPPLPFAAAVGIESADLDRTRFLLANAGITIHGRPDRLLVPPSEGLGAWIDFHRAGAPPLWAA
ncbi:MAG: VOC family protein [Alphaproteobacteria bacterium]|nr:VOC family protein [Alphaproteobacteria bacterium]